jgi:hypothetical protein
MPIPAAFLKNNRKKAAEGSAAEEGMESTKMEKGESPEYGDAPHGKSKKPCAACMKKGKKKGSCGCAAKATLDAVLTPTEYLDACDLGIQNRSRSYVRGVLSVREDKKCGASGIAEGKKCNKSLVGTVKSALGNENVQTGLKVAAVAGGIAAGTVGAMKYRGMQKNAMSNLRVAKNLRATSRMSNPRPTNSAGGIPDPWTNQVSNSQASMARSMNNKQARGMLSQGAIPPSKARVRKATKAAVSPAMAKAQAGIASTRRAARKTQIGLIRQKRRLFGGN